jgi:hypothetical protein
MAADTTDLDRVIEDLLESHASNPCMNDEQDCPIINEHASSFYIKYHVPGNLSTEEYKITSVAGIR